MACAGDSSRPLRCSRMRLRTSWRTGISRSNTSGNSTAKPAGAAQQRDQAPVERRRDLPTSQSVIRLVGAILLEQDDEWAVAERRYFSAESMKQLTAPTLPATAQEIFAAIA